MSELVSGSDRELDRICKFRPKESYTTGDLLNLMGISERQLFTWLNNGTIPSRKIPGSSHRRIDHTPLKSWLKSEPKMALILDRLEWAEKLASRMSHARQP